MGWGGGGSLLFTRHKHGCHLQALEMLLRGSTAVIPGVKLQQLHRLSRSTGARILPSVNFLDKLDEAEVIGTAGEAFQIWRYRVNGSSLSPSLQPLDFTCAHSMFLVPGVKIVENLR